MATLDDIVSVQIALQTAGVVSGNFGTPMIVGPHMAWGDRVRTYSNFAEASDDNLPPLILAALSDCFGQTPRPQQVKVGRRAVLKGIITVGTVTNSGVYTLKIDGQTYTITADSATSATEIVTALAAEITADTDETVTATVATDTLELAWIGAAGTVEIVTSNLVWGLISPLAAGSAVADDLDAINDIDRDWYGLVMTERVKQTQLDAAAWVESNEKLFVTASAEAAILTQGDSTDIVSMLKALNYFRTAILYHANAATEYPDAAWIGRVFTIQPGAETWALKNLASITVVKLSTTDANTIKTKGGNTFESYSQNVAITNPGKVVAGEWIDVIRFRDWLKDQIQVNMVSMLINRDKVPYTDQGIQLCVNNLRMSLQNGQNVGGIAPDELNSEGESVPGYTITYPRSSEVSQVTKATRILHLSFTGRLAGAIHAVEVTGTLAYEL